MEYESFCRDCKENTEVVWDHATGDIICTECALVLESHYIDDTPEWRTFADDSKDNDPIRVGGPTTFTALLTDSAVLSTVITLPKGTKPTFMPPTFNGKKREPNTKQSYLDAGFDTIANMVDRLGLVATIKIFNGVFIEVNKATLNMLHKVEPYVLWLSQFEDRQGAHLQEGLWKSEQAEDCFD